jgi:hypothetical protein
MASSTLPCVLTVLSVMQVALEDGRKCTLAVGEGRVLDSAVHGHHASVVGFARFRPERGQNGQQLQEIPSILSVRDDSPIIRLAIPVQCIICNLIARFDQKLFLPVMKITTRS